MCWCSAWNKLLCRTRVIVERVFGKFKRQWAIARTETLVDVVLKSHMIHACCILHNMTCIDGDLPLNGTYDCGGCRDMSLPLPLLSTLTSPCVGSVDFLEVRRERAAMSVLPLAVLRADAALTRAGDVKRRHLMDGAFATTLCARAVETGGTFVVGAHAFHIDPAEAVACVQEDEEEGVYEAS